MNATQVKGMTVAQLKALTLKEGLELVTTDRKEVLISKLLLHFAPPADTAPSLDATLEETRKVNKKKEKVIGCLAPVFTALKGAFEAGETIPGVTVTFWSSTKGSGKNDGMTIRPTGKPITGKGRAILVNIMQGFSASGATLGYFTLRESGYLTAGGR